MPTDLVVAYTSVGGGHKAAALALAEAAEGRGLSVALVDTFDHAPRIVGDTYLTAHLSGQAVAPQVYGSMYFAANQRRGALEPVRRGLDHVLFAGLARKVRALAPRVVVATHHLPLVVLGRERLRGGLAAPLWGVITDYTAHAHWAEEGVDGFCVPCPLAARELALHDVPAHRIHQTGIPVRHAFGLIEPLREPRRDEAVRVLVTSGGFGVGPISTIVRSFAGHPRAEVTVVCGTKPGLQARVLQDAASVGVFARVLGFEPDMAKRVADAHILVGKGGGLTVTECLTAGRPMLVAGAVPGNEAFNEAFVVNGRAGYAVAPGAVGAAVSLLATRREIAATGARARALVGTGAAHRILDLAAPFLGATRLGSGESTSHRPGVRAA